MLKIWDYVYYRTYAVYKIKWKAKLPWLYALGLVSLLQCTNIVAIHFTYLLFNYQKTHVIANPNEYTGSIIILILIGLNYFRYNRIIPFRILEKSWNNENKKSRKIKGYLTVSYIIISLVIFIGLATLLGEINQGRI